MKYLEIFGVGFHATGADVLSFLHHFWGSEELIILEIAISVKDHLGYSNISPAVTRIQVYYRADRFAWYFNIDGGAA